MDTVCLLFEMSVAYLLWIPHPSINFNILESKGCYVCLLCILSHDTKHKYYAQNVDHQGFFFLLRIISDQEGMAMSHCCFPLHPQQVVLGMCFTQHLRLEFWNTS